MHSACQANLHYSDPELVSLYDTINVGRHDVEFYLALPIKHPSRILDAGCGTGTLAIEFGDLGHIVTAIDPAPEMIAHAQQKPGADRVSWEVSELSSYRSNDFLDLVVMTGHTFQCLLNDHDIYNCFHTVLQRLAPSGCFVADTRNPSLFPWQRWTPEHASGEMSGPDGTTFEVVPQLLNVTGERVSFQETYVLGAEQHCKISISTLRFARPETINRLAERAGMHLRATYGDWDASAFDPAESREYIFNFDVRHYRDP